MKGKVVVVMPQISLCMIVRDEEPSIARCLQSAGQLADELILVDTGSGDATPRIGREMGAQVFPFPWGGDFAAARNFSLEKARGAWILWLDADEELIVTDRASLLSQMQGTGAQGLSVPMRHFYGAQPPCEQQVHFSSAIRLFRGDAGLIFQGRVHERLRPADGGDIRVEAAQGLRIDHYGYMEQGRGRKCARNLALLLKEWDERQGDPWLAYHMAVELHRMGMLAESCQMVNEAIRRFLDKGLMPPSLLYKLKYETLVMTGRYEAAYPAIEKAVQLYPDYADLHFYRGLVLWHLGQIQEAASAFSRCLELGDADPKYLTTRGMGSYFALYFLGACREKLGDGEAALRLYRQALAQYPESALFQARVQDAPPEGQGAFSQTT